MPQHLPTSSFTFLPPPTARHYHPTLSIWISVDPVSDKYPEVSPYTYCANNPVRLVDPDGRQWEDDDDKIFADNLVHQAKSTINSNENKINYLSSNKLRAFFFKKEISNLKKENIYLKEGIANIEDMATDVSTTYHFESISSGDGGVFKTSSGTQNIQYRNTAMAWHETVHIGDARANPHLWGFDADSFLGTTEENLYKSEVKAYSSQYSFDHFSMNMYNNSTIYSLDDIGEWIIINTNHRPYKKEN